MNEPELRSLKWIGTSRRDIRAFSKSVRRAFGQSLFAVQCGETPPGAKPLKGFGGAGVLEFVEDDRAGTYRAVYTVRFSTAVYVLHVFQKKSKRGIATPPQELELVKERLKRAAGIHAASLKGKMA
jgi:phage-related protein